MTVKGFFWSNFPLVVISTPLPPKIKGANAKPASLIVLLFCQFFYFFLFLGRYYLFFLKIFTPNLPKPIFILLFLYFKLFIKFWFQFWSFWNRYFAFFLSSSSLSLLPSSHIPVRYSHDSYYDFFAFISSFYFFHSQTCSNKTEKVFYVSYKWRIYWPSLPSWPTLDNVRQNCLIVSLCYTVASGITKRFIQSTQSRTCVLEKPKIDVSTIIRSMQFAWVITPF